jgi:Bacterial Ig-like domain
MQRAILAALFVTPLAACAGGGSTAPSEPCPAVTGVFDSSAKLVSPANGATGVPTTVGTVSFTVTIASLRSGTLTLFVPGNPGNQGAVQGGPISTDANGVSSSSVPALAPHTTYTVGIVARPVDPVTGCPGQAGATPGSFTTQ